MSFLSSCDGCVITFEGTYVDGDDYFYETVLNDCWYSGPDLYAGEYTVKFKGKTGNVYSVEPLSIHMSNVGYENYNEYPKTKEYDIDLEYGDYTTRDSDARIICEFSETEDLDLSNVTFYFVDSDNKRTNDCSYLELKYGLIRLPKDKTYKIIASGLPEGYELDYGKMSSIRPLQEHCGDGRYDYTVAIKKAEPYKPLAIVNDTEDIVAKNGTKVTFTIEAEGTGLNYSWYYKKPGAEKYKKAGAYTNEYTRTAGKRIDGMQAYCLITDATGKTVKSDVITFNLKK